MSSTYNYLTSVKKSIYARPWLLATIATLLVIASSFAGYVIYGRLNNSQPILSQITDKKLTFPLFWPTKDSTITASKQSVKYDPSVKLISYNAITNNGVRLIITEQETPTSFSDIPQVFSKLVETMSQYGVFDSQNGTVYLTHPKELKGGQAAVMNSKGTLMFVKPITALDDDSWKVFFNSLQIAK